MMKALMAGTLPSLREACPWVSKSIEAVVARAVAPSREDRYATALELQVALEECMVELGGFVQQREVASFMETEFGAWRRDRQRSVDAELRKPAVALGDVLEVSELEIESASLQHGHVSSRIDEPERRRWLVPVFGLLLAAVAAGLLLFARSRERAEQALPPPAATPLAPPASKPLVRDAPAAAAQPIAPPSAVEDAANETPSAAASVKVPRSRAPALRPVAPRAVPAPAAPAAPVASARHCTPPYVLDSEGVKTYKPECL